MDDLAIIELYHSRDESAISRTDEKYGRYLGSIAFNVLHDSFESDECVNDTYFRAWRAMPPKRPSVLSAFLARITRNLALDKYSAKRAEKRVPAEVTLCLDELAECIADESADGASERIGECINAFLKEQRQIDRMIFVKRYFNCDSVAVIAKALRISEGQAKTALSRMRVRLKAILESEGVFR